MRLTYGFFEGIGPWRCQEERLAWEGGNRFANSIPTFFESARKCLSSKDISSSVQNFSDSSGKPRLRDHRAGRSGRAGVACQPHDQDVWGGAQPSDDTPTHAADGTPGEGLLDRARLPGTSTHARVCVRPLRCPASWPAATLGMPTAHHRGQRVISAMDVSDPSHGSWAD